MIFVFRGLCDIVVITPLIVLIAVALERYKVLDDLASATLDPPVFQDAVQLVPQTFLFIEFKRKWWGLITSIFMEGSEQ
jgi:hypothetical protein